MTARAAAARALVVAVAFVAGFLLAVGAYRLGASTPQVAVATVVAVPLAALRPGHTRWAAVAFGCGVAALHVLVALVLRGIEDV